MSPRSCMERVSRLAWAWRDVGDAKHDCRDVEGLAAAGPLAASAWK
jgi:hypothetical protein